MSEMKTIEDYVEEEKMQVYLEDDLKIVKVKYKSEYFFKKYAFKDMDGTYWETKKQKDDYELGEDFELPWASTDLMPSIDKKYIDKVSDIFQGQYQHHTWGIERIILEKDEPEYFV